MNLNFCTELTNPQSLESGVSLLKRKKFLHGVSRYFLIFSRLAKTLYIGSKTCAFIFRLEHFYSQLRIRCVIATGDFLSNITMQKKFFSEHKLSKNIPKNLFQIFIVAAQKQNLFTKKMQTSSITF